VTKGYLVVRVSGPQGIEVDLYNTHLDARTGGTSNRPVRREQLEQLASAIRTHSSGRALILAGDLNTGHQRPEDFALLESFRAELGLDDAGARRDASWGGEADVDYILYRSGTDTHIRLVEGNASHGEDAGFRWRERGRRLSDHPAIFARFHAARRR
jgi:endonuclease/exonuclease/phosphatase (EEP) superfamily protein YafD